MCLALPALIVALPSTGAAIVDIGGVRKEISVELVDDVEPGDYVVVHVGYALARLDAAEAQRTLELFASAGGSPANGTHPS
ncbi:MAG TPA: HypC/HybG/HupF family hydrogenase formation chaperone [Casimicrobiaceae bacterium]|nr:HypC/HybG/HupF family hydrogenase formation chaperone [Casimicrobiaceae bacterium]